MKPWYRRGDVWVVIGLVLVALASSIGFAFSEETVVAWDAFVRLISGG